MKHDLHDLRGGLDCSEEGLRCADLSLLPASTCKQQQDRVETTVALVSENASNAARNAGISKNARLCTDPIPCHVFTTKQLLSCYKTAHRKLHCAAT